MTLLRFDGILILSIMTVTSVTRPDLLAALEDLGYRLTGPRHDVINLLSQKQDGFSTQEVCDALPGVGRATVYRTIKVLLEAGALCKVALPDGAPKYTLASFGHHHHTVCIKCGTVGDFRGPTIERLLRTIEANIPGEIVGHRIELYLTCQECLAKPEG